MARYTSNQVISVLHPTDYHEDRVTRVAFGTVTRDRGAVFVGIDVGFEAAIFCFSTRTTKKIATQCIIAEPDATINRIPFIRFIKSFNRYPIVPIYSSWYQKRTVLRSELPGNLQLSETLPDPGLSRPVYGLIANELNHCCVREFAPAFARRTPLAAIYNK